MKNGSPAPQLSSLVVVLNYKQHHNTRTRIHVTPPQTNQHYSTRLDSTGRLHSANQPLSPLPAAAPCIQTGWWRPFAACAPKPVAAAAPRLRTSSRTAFGDHSSSSTPRWRKIRRPRSTANGSTACTLCGSSSDTSICKKRNMENEKWKKEKRKKGMKWNEKVQRNENANNGGKKASRENVRVLD